MDNFNSDYTDSNTTVTNLPQRHSKKPEELNKKNQHSDNYTDEKNSTNESIVKTLEITRPIKKIVRVKINND